jgi:hypothetical protein
MEAQIRRHVDTLFENTPPTRKAVELKEEMIQNLTEKYRDLIDEGKSPEAAFNITVAGIGDVSGLLADLEKEGVSPDALAAAREKSALRTAVAVMMYILSVVPLIVLSALVHNPAAPIIGLIFMFVFIAAATGLLIYDSMTKPKYVKREDTMVEEFRQWQAESKDMKNMRSSVYAAIWALLAALYFIISFTTGAWHVTWVIFIIGVAVQAILNAVFAARKRG